jgi:DNA topoisomerase VI subunit B
VTGETLQISTEGFASFNKSRPPSHLVKELVQNALDAIGDTEGEILLDYRHDGKHFHLSCRDNGTGIHDLDAIKIVYLTFKTDSHLKRGRFGRGFKEILSVANWARVKSGVEQIKFLIKNGRQITRRTKLPATQPQ